VSKCHYKCLLISSFTIDNFASYLTSHKLEPSIDVIKASSYDQVSRILLDKNNNCWQENPDFAILWTQPERIIGSFQKLLESGKESMENILSEVDEYASQVLNVRNNIKYIFVPSWTLTGGNKGSGLLDMKPCTGVANTLMKMNLRLVDNFAQESNIFILNSQRWIEKAGKNSFVPKLWYMAKIPFGNDVFQEAVKDIKAIMQAAMGLSKKLIILDLDDTLWGGIVGDEGWQNIRLGGHDYIGESYVDFQRELKALSKKGIILGIVSKNDEKIAFEAINKHPEMVLRQDDFAGWRINWNDKAKNILELVEELNLGLQSVVFIDNNPAERDRVREALLEVLVLDWPQDSMLYKQTLSNLRCFDSPSISIEDLNKTKMYMAERERTKVKKNVPSLDEWLKSLHLTIKIESLSESNIKRAVQLLNKTNQMNLSTRRLSESELLKWEQSEGNHMWVFYISDKFGDSGLTGISSMNCANADATIVDFVLSCRVMGRKIEEAMLSFICRYSKDHKVKKVKAIYIPTAKNNPCLNFFNHSGFNHKPSGFEFSWDLSNDYSLPSFISIEELKDCFA
jgi:FkbH-like protein|tara:strand:+ start:369 stop:2072 length:1704 start_codon:yes stop_codon:yes gene_type:complete